MKYFLMGRFQCARVVLLELFNTSPPFVLFELIRALHFSVHRLFRALFAQICKVFSVRESMILKIQDMLIRLINQLQKMSWFFCSGLVSSTLQRRAGGRVHTISLGNKSYSSFPHFLRGSKLQRDVKMAHIDYQCFKKSTLLYNKFEF